MSGRERRRPLARVALVAFTCLACFHTTAPPGWLPAPEEVRQSAFGAWASVVPDDSARRRVDGELIAVDRDSIHVLTATGLVSLGMHAVRDVTLTTFAQPRGDLQAWALFGTASAATHGLFAVLTVPTWLLVGGLSNASAARAPVVELKDGVDELRKFARFPQGLPATLDRTVLQPRGAAFHSTVDSSGDAQRRDRIQSDGRTPR